MPEEEQDSSAPLLAEFQTLRAEHDLRVGKQQEISQFALALIGALIALFGALMDDGGVGEIRGLCPIVSLLLSGLMLMALDHEMNIAHIQMYISTKLGGRVLTSLGRDAIDSGSQWGWVAFRAARQQHPSGLAEILTNGLASAKYWTTLLPNVGVLIAFAVTASGHRDPWYGWVAFAIALVVLLFALSASVYTSRLYLEMTYDKDR